jgi:hypothetical protein
MTTTSLEIIQADKQLWKQYLSNRTPENKRRIESFEKLEWTLDLDLSKPIKGQG